MNHPQKSETAIYSNFVKVNNSHTNHKNDTIRNDVFQKYTILQNFGAGSMGAVYKVKLKQDLNYKKQRDTKKKGLFTLLRNTFTTTGTTTTTTTTAAAAAVVVPRQPPPPDEERQRDRDMEGVAPDHSNNDDDNDDYYALKCIAFDRISNEFIDELQNEIRILKNMDHPNIVKAYEVFYEYDKKKKKNLLVTTTTSNHNNDQIKMLYVVMELCTGGDLYSRTPYSEKDAAKIITQLLSAIW
jgi:serine/threonine protein kinase